MSAVLPVGRHLDDATLRLWMMLVLAGGYSHLREIRRQWFASDAPEVVEDRVARLLENAMVREYKRPGKHRAFGVTGSCKAPPGYEAFMQVAARKEPGSFVNSEATVHELMQACLLQSCLEKSA